MFMLPVWVQVVVVVDGQGAVPPHSERAVVGHGGEGKPLAPFTVRA